jgi:hypothetical protein
MFAAFVVSVVAEAANPLVCVLGITGIFANGTSDDTNGA